MSNSSNKTNIPEAKSAMNKFKMEVANEIGVPLSDGYNGNLTSAQNGSVGGYMVKKMIEAQERQMVNNPRFTIWTKKDKITYAESCIGNFPCPLLPCQHLGN